jgi:hypothetical protein
VFGSNNGNGNGISGISAHGIGVLGKGGSLAGFFDGNVFVTGKIDAPNGNITCSDVTLSPLAADCAEEFDLVNAEAVEPGTVMSLCDDGALAPSTEAYDTKVAGVISGAGEYRPGIVLDRRKGENRVPIALVGKVFCKVDAQNAPIAVGDLLTSSSTPGYAMKATDPFKTFGTVIGKALRPLESGRGTIPILISLH